MDKTQRILQDLFRFFGSKERPAEWDGSVYGGNKLSQRYWELLTVIKLAELDEDSVALDIGGSGAGVDYEQYNGAGFLARLLAPHIKRVVVADPACKDGSHGNIHTIGTPAFEDSKRWERNIKDHPISCVLCASVLEHIEHKERLRMLSRLHDFATTRGIDKLVFSLEYHPVTRFWNHQLNGKDLGECFAVFKNYYPDTYLQSATRCENGIAQDVIPMWTPIVLRLRANQ